MSRVVYVAVVALALSPLSALAKPSWQISNELSNVLGSEKFCGLKYDQAAITTFIEKNVPADDMGFAGSLRASSQMTEENIGKMSESLKTAHCTQIKRVAKAYGFIKD